MQSNKAKAEALGRKAKLANSYQELLDEFSDKDLKNVGNYTLGKLIGKGSFGKVYLANHKLTNGSKVVLKSANKDDSNLAREIHHHRQFVHPHIARLYEIIVTESLVWLVLEYCPGDELYNYLLKNGTLPVEKTQRIFTQLVGAVSYVHQQSCVHRDLKLENILLDKHENVKLVDFGFTREYEGKANYLQTFCGTICYSAPEMLKGEKYAGEKIDVWSLGVILYALLCGELPFDEDDDNITRTKILTEEPKYPERLPPDAIALIRLLLSKRPLLRPTLPEILSHPFLAEHAPQQQAILKLHQPPPFTTHLEKDCLQRMRSAGVDIDAVIESVLAQRCDVLAGWWTLLLEKEERKARRRERRRKEKESENRNSRRFSAASSKLERMAPILDEDPSGSGEPPLPKTRGRPERRSARYSDSQIPELPNLPESQVKGHLSPDGSTPPPPIDKDSVRSVSSSRHQRPIPPPKEGILRSARSRGSTLHLVTTSDALGNSEVRELNPPPKVRKKPSQAIVATWKNWTHWIVENTRRHKPNKRGSMSTPNLATKDGQSGNKNPKDASPRPHTSKYPASLQGAGTSSGGNSPSLPNGNAKSTGAAGGSNPTKKPVPTPLRTPSNSGPRRMPSAASSYKRQSLSPVPLTPRSTIRRSSTGLRGRKSTSSSLSSIRTMPHHHHSHSKASSTSSTGSVSTTKTPGRSPHHSVKVLPATPTNKSFPSNIRLVRGPALSLNFNEGMPSSKSGPNPPGSPNPFSSNSPSVLFAKRKRNIFKGPMLSIGSQSRSSGNSGGHSRSASASGLGRRSGEITIQEEDEEAEEEIPDIEADDDVEEVDQFSPVAHIPGQKIEEIYEVEGEIKEAVLNAAASVEAGTSK
ncbi:kinase-like protein [Hypoxylon trugodes]|uniref:kinase-like protein n=1 Tax=Hypoxylon trugodes TaxID=326681 RepID=UPI00218D9CDA|nr:kinase-like protein [Hypoxylon trugodes]KAI1390389.1 kinase-like protein [Hypoxylon trugodes]